MSRFCLCGGDFCAFNLGFVADPCNAVQEIGCCNTKPGPSGFGWHSTAHEVCASLCKRLDGKLVVVTGGNAGVGLEVSKALYEVGATVILACRSEARASTAMKHIMTSASPLGGAPGSLVFVPLDLSSLASVEACAKSISAMSEPLAALVCNAGMMAVPFALTGDGLETQFQVNYLAHHHLSMLLLDKLKASAPARIINVSSISHAWVPFPGGCCGSACGLCFGGFDLTGKRFPAKSAGCCAYEAFEDYSYSKAAQVIMTKELDRRVLRGTGVASIALEPGLSVVSGIADGSPCLRFVTNYTCIPKIMGALVGKSLPQMASTVVFAALSDTVKSGDYLRNVNIASPVGPAADAANGPLLWELSTQALSAHAAGSAGRPRVSAPQPVTM
jgi:NAD(P)-dependent dehydrogenase (short-subunit alcohol dehydrogenase family)